MSNVLALIPARAGSKGILNKNFTPLAGTLPVHRAILVARDALWPDYRIVVSTDYKPSWSTDNRVTILKRPAELAQDDTPMIAVVQHALEQIPGPPDQIIVLLQPTQPLRKPEHITKAITLLQETQADSVVSVVELPLTHSPEMVLALHRGRLQPWLAGIGSMSWTRNFPMTRQEAMPVYMRDGTAYVFWRKTVDAFGTIYGEDVRPLIIPPNETCPLDTPEDWAEAERRLRP